MHRAFRLLSPEFKYPSIYRLRGTLLHSNQEDYVLKSFQAFIDKGQIDGSLLQNEWFPPLPCDVFISHSHSDEDLAIQLAGWLKLKLGLTSFIDSCAWGHARHLLRELDDEYCYQEETKTYNYRERNRTTSHVHMKWPRFSEPKAR